MKVFHMAKNIKNLFKFLPPPVAREAILTPETIETIKRVLQEAPDGTAIPCETPSLFGITIICEESPATRRVLAVAMAAAHGRPVLFEDGDGNILECKMPKAEFLPLGNVTTCHR